MGQFHDEIPSFLIPWIKKQHMFWVASAPLAADGHVNVSSKGVEGTFHVIDSRTVWYEDLFGSGVETISHVRENGRITILFNAFEGPPRIARLFGTGTVYEFGTPEYNKLLPPEVRNAGSRSVIMIDVHKVGTSCGFAVPFYEFKGHRPKYPQTAVKVEAVDIVAESQLSDKSNSSTPSNETKMPGLKQAFREWNSYSIDGLPALLTAFDAKDSFVPRAADYVEKKSKEGLPVSVVNMIGETKVDGGSAKLGVVDVKFFVGIFVGLFLAVVYGEIVKESGLSINLSRLRGLMA